MVKKKLIILNQKHNKFKKNVQKKRLKDIEFELLRI